MRNSTFTKSAKTNRATKIFLSKSTNVNIA